MQVNLGNLPKASPTYVVNFPQLNGGLNLRDLSYRLDVNESPDMKNLWWQDGVLQCRNGQEWYCDNASLGAGYACYDRLFHGYAILHIGGKLYRADPTVSVKERRFRCLLSGSVDGEAVTIESDVVTLTVGKPMQTLTILSQPKDRVAAYGAAATFTVVAATNRPDPLSYQWYFRPSGTDDWERSTAVSGRRPTYSVTAAARHNGYQYKCAVTDGTNTVESNIVTLTTKPEEEMPGFAILQQPSSFQALPNTTAMFTVVDVGATGYQWQELIDDEWADVSGADTTTLTLTIDLFPLDELCSGVPENRGTFFPYQERLFYKNRGGYFKISYDNGVFDAVDMTSSTEAYAPVIVINASPDNGSGTIYQPENRLSPQKTVWYNADATKTVYHLPVQDVDSVDRVVRDGAEVTTGFTVDLTNGTVTFDNAPDPGTPPANNTVQITYSKANPLALSSVLDCPYGFVAGEGANLCILLGGCPAQPNAVFWNSNDNLSMNPGYFPIPYYNLCGSAGDAVTGFGMQYSDLILFSERSIGKLIFGIEKLDDRDSISFTYQNINDRVGCNLPWTIQLVQNNLTFCNTERGVYIVRSSSAAYENNVDCISDKVDGGDHGLTADVRAASLVVSADDGRYYWLCLGDKVYAWNYEESTAEKPSWYYFRGIAGIGFFGDGAEHLYHLDAMGRVTKFVRGFSDYGGVIEKYYTFATQSFGGYDRLKDVVYILLTVRGDTDSVIHIRYDTDYERRVDLTPIYNFTWRLSPRNLSYRCLAVTRFGRVAKRLPGCRHVRHFSLTLADWGVGEDLSIVSAQMFYRYTGKER